MTVKAMKGYSILWLLLAGGTLLIDALLPGSFSAITMGAIILSSGYNIGAALLAEARA